MKTQVISALMVIFIAGCASVQSTGPCDYGAQPIGECTATVEGWGPYDVRTDSECSRVWLDYPDRRAKSSVIKIPRKDRPLRLNGVSRPQITQCLVHPSRG